MRGGGKSWFVRAKSKLLALNYAGIKILIVRRTYPELVNNHINFLIPELKDIARYNKTEKEFKFSNGSSIKFGYCNTDSDLLQYQGAEYDVIFLDEATQLSEIQMKTIGACVRGVNDFPKRIYYTCNPGGQGHHYIKRIFIEKRYEDGEDADDYEFIQALVQDNDALMKTQPDYVKQLQALPPKVREAWLNGSWDSFEGLFFESFRDTPDIAKITEMGVSTEEAMREGIYTHVIKPFDVSRLDSSWKFIRSYDWGFGKPFSMGYWVYKDDVLYRILEVYGSNGTPNEGRKWTNKEQFDYFQKLEHEHPWLKGRKIDGVADPSIWDGSHDTYGISCAEEGEKHGIYFQKGNNERVAGWMQVQERLRFDEHGKALIYFFDNCKDSIRTIPMMMYDKNKVEDLDSSLEDHACDEIRYCAMQHIVAPRTIKNEDIPLCDPLNQYRKSEKTAYIKYL